MTWELHWNLKQRPRDFAALLDRLTTFGRACGNLITSDKSCDTSAALFQLHSALEARQSLLGDIRSCFDELVQKELPLQYVNSLQECPTKLLAQIIMQYSHKMLDKVLVDPPLVQPWIGVVKADPTRNVKWLSLGLVGYNDTGLDCQLRMIHSFADMVWKNQDARIIEHILLKLDGMFSEPIGCLAPLPVGWGLTAWADISCLRVCGKVLAHTGASSNNASPPRQLRIDCIKIGSISENISTRLKTHFKAINGSSHQHGQTTFAYITKLIRNTKPLLARARWRRWPSP